MTHAAQTSDTNRPRVCCRKSEWVSLRTRTGLVTDAALSAALGVSRPTVGRVLTGSLEPSGHFIAAALHAFRFASFDRLFEVV